VAVVVVMMTMVVVFPVLMVVFPVLMVMPIEAPIIRPVVSPGAGILIVAMISRFDNYGCGVHDHRGWDGDTKRDIDPGQCRPGYGKRRERQERAEYAHVENRVDTMLCLWHGHVLRITGGQCFYIMRRGT
jgi:hypothetical protein